jgi:hypothetical protein
MDIVSCGVTFYVTLVFDMLTKFVVVDAFSKSTLNEALRRDTAKAKVGKEVPDLIKFLTL